LVVFRDAGGLDAKGVSSASGVFSTIGVSLVGFLADFLGAAGLLGEDGRGWSGSSGEEGASSCWSIRPWITSGSSKRSSSSSIDGVGLFAFREAAFVPLAGDLLFSLDTFVVLAADKPLSRCSSLCSSGIADDGSLLCRRDVLGLLARGADALGSLPALEAGLAKVWQRSVPRFTPTDRRNDFALVLRGGDGGGGGDCFFCGFCTVCTAKSTLVRRLEALTGGDEVGAGRLDVSTDFLLGSRILAGGGLGVSMGIVTGSSNTLERMSGKVMMGVAGTDLTALAGVLDRVISEMWSDSEEIVMTLADR
jgi:hypothetical protein